MKIFFYRLNKKKAALKSKATKKKSNANTQNRADLLNENEGKK